MISAIICYIFIDLELLWIYFFFIMAKYPVRNILHLTAVNLYMAPFETFKFAAKILITILFDI